LKQILELTVDKSVSGQKALGLLGRFELLHLPVPALVSRCEFSAQGSIFRRATP
jgi:hypothetical protein